MKKKSFKKALTEKMEEIGYLPFITDIKSETTFIKHLENKHYLVVGFRTSRYDRNVLIASFYLSWIPIYAIVSPPIGKYYADVIGFLTDKECEEYVPVKHYWEKTDENLFNNLAKAITLAEPRFLNQKDIYSDIARLEIIVREYPFLKEVIALFHSSTDLPELQYKLSKQAVKLEPRWYQASEAIYHTHASKEFHPSVIETWALEAYSIDKYAQLYGMPTEAYLNR